MMITSLVQTLENQRTGGAFAVPAIELTAGIRNKFSLDFKETCDEAPALPEGAAKLRLSLRGMPAMERSLATFGDAVCTSMPVEVSVVVPAKLRRGYYFLHAVVLDDSDTPIGVYQAYAVVDKQADPIADNHLALRVIRAALGDLFAGDNEMLGFQEFATGDIAAAVERSLLTWNSRPPFTSAYIGNNFPYPEILLTGVSYELLQATVNRLERNRNQYQAGGLATDLERRADYYAKKMAEYRTLWFNGVTSIKQTEDENAFSGSLQYGN